MFFFLFLLNNIKVRLHYFLPVVEQAQNCTYSLTVHFFPHTHVTCFKAAGRWHRLLFNLNFPAKWSLMGFFLLQAVTRPPVLLNLSFCLSSSS